MSERRIDPRFGESSERLTRVLGCNLSDDCPHSELTLESPRKWSRRSLGQKLTLWRTRRHSAVAKAGESHPARGHALDVIERSRIYFGEPDRGC